MDDLNQKKRVKITHFINPNRFYLYNLEHSAELNCLRQLEQSLQNYCAEKKQKLQTEQDVERKLAKNDIVGFRSVASKKWIRCEVEIAKQNNSAVLWALDYGLPLTTNKADELIFLPDKYRYNTPIISAGLSVLPAQSDTKKVQQKIQKYWSENALKYFKKVLNAAHTVYFQSQRIEDEDILFGKLFVETLSGETVDLVQQLLHKQMALIVPDCSFISHFNTTFSSIIERWNDNNGTDGAIIQADSLMVTRIASSSSAVVSRWAQKEITENEIKKQVEEQLKSSIDKVTAWYKKNEGIEPEDVEDKEEAKFREEFADYDFLAASKPQVTSTKALSKAHPPSISKLFDVRRFNFKFTSLPAHPGSQLESLESCQESKQSSRKMVLLPAGGQTKTAVNFRPSSSKSIQSKYSVLSNEKLDVFEKKNADKKVIRTELKAGVDATLGEVNAAKPRVWMSLSVGSEYPIFISSFGSCSSFYIQIDSDNDGWDELMSLLNNAKPMPMMDLAIGKICLVETNSELNRAKIICLSKSYIMCFCVDSGELIFLDYPTKAIYEIPEAILEFMPFQAVNCRLSGIKTFSDASWTNIIYKTFVKPIFRPRMRIISKLDFDSSFIYEGIEGINSYEVDVFEKDSENNERNLGNSLVENQLARYGDRF